MIHSERWRSVTQKGFLTSFQVCEARVSGILFRKMSVRIGKRRRHLAFEKDYGNVGPRIAEILLDATYNIGWSLSYHERKYFYISIQKMPLFSYMYEATLNEVSKTLSI
jgi:hypothetical protein